MAATVVTAGKVQTKMQIRSTCVDANKIMLMLEQAMVKVCEWSERIEAQTSATVEHDVGAWKQRVVNYEDVLKRKVAALTEAEKEQSRLRRAVEERDEELAKVRAELEAERRTHTDAERLRGQLTETHADIKSLKRRLGMAKTDVEQAGIEARKISDAFQILQEEQKRKSAKWKRIQHRLTADVESMTTENGRLKQEVGRLTTETAKLREETEKAVQRALPFQEQLEPLKTELKVANNDARKTRSLNRELQKDVVRLQEELGKKQYQAQANLRCIVDKFREKRKVEIELATATTLHGWSEQAEIAKKVLALCIKD
jgi:chromosome segregation ATPase